SSDVCSSDLIRLRWGTSPALRRLSLLGYGLNIWRNPLTNALALGYNTNPPSILQLQGGAFNRVNQGPVIATKDFDVGHGIGSADDPTDRITDRKSTRLTPVTDQSRMP